MISNVFTYYNTNSIKPTLRCRCEMSNASESETNSLYSMDAMILGSKKNSIDRGSMLAASNTSNTNEPLSSSNSNNRGIPILFNNSSNKTNTSISQPFKNSPSSINETGSVLNNHPVAYSLNTSSFNISSTQDSNSQLGSSVPNQYGAIFIYALNILYAFILILFYLNKN